MSSIASGTSQPTAKSAREPSLRRRRSRWTRSSASSSRPAQQSVPAPTCGFVEHALRAEGRSSAVAMSSCSTLRRPRALRDLLALGEETTLRADFELPERTVSRTSRAPWLMDSPRTSWIRLSIRSSPVRRRSGRNSRASGCDPYDPSPRPAALRRRHAEREAERRRSPRRPAPRVRGAPERAVWLTDQDAAALLDASRRQRRSRARRRLRPNGGRWSRSARAYLAEIAAQRGEALLDAHRRVRRGSEAAVAPTRSSRSSRSTCSGFTSSSLSWTRSR